MTHPSQVPEEEVHPTKSGEWRETHQIHTSELRSYRGCRRRWNWAYRQGYVPTITPRPLELGIAFHTGLQTFFNPKTWDSTNAQEKCDLAIQAYMSVCESQREVFLKSTNQERVEVAEGDDYTERIELGIGMLEYYAYQIHPKDDNWFKPVYVEVPFSVPLHHPDTDLPILCVNPGTDSGQCGQNHPIGAPVTFNGRVDAIVEDIFNGGYFIWDHKTAGQLQSNDRLLQLDDQVGGYSWALRRILEIDIRGFVYAEFRKDYPKPPQLLKRRYKSGWFSQSKSQGTSLNIFLETVKKFDTEAYNEGVYAEYIAFLSGKEAPVFHRRFPIIKTPYELEQIGYNIGIQAAEMVTPTLPIYPAPGRYSCSGCAYYDPCTGTNNGEDVAYTLSTLYKKVK